MIRQRPLKGGREGCAILVDPVVHHRLLREAARFGTSASFVGNTALAEFFRYELDETYQRAQRRAKKRKARRS